jgi:glycosyltransferase involved in cell wall biosynthesis
MDEAVFISICIPAYKRVSFLKRLLDSIRIQTFRDFEVVLADDSPDNEVYELSRTHGLADSIRYFKNEKTLGTPANWNESIRRARGTWIKLMHDDDWFSDPEALGSFAKAIKNSPGSLFFFSGYTNVFLDQNRSEPVMIPGLWRRILERNTKSLISGM